MESYDFSGWATRNNLRCSDGRTILKDAFKTNDGQTVPLVWNHQHNESYNVLGHALLENRDDGVYAYCTLNDTDAGKNAKLLVKHGDISALSIYANQLKQQMPEAQVIALSVGGEALNNAKGRKDVLSRGPDELVVVVDAQFEQALPHQTASGLAAAVNKLGFDLILCGDGSADLYAQQVSLLLGEALQVPELNGISQIVSLTQDAVVVMRELEEETETLTVPLPAVLAVSTDINAPQIPSMKAILGAAKKPVQAWSAANAGLGQIAALSAQQVTAPKQKARQHIIIEGDGDDNIAAFADHLRKLIK